MRIRKGSAEKSILYAVLLTFCGIPLSALALPASPVFMQAQPAAASRILGTVTAVSSTGLTVKPATGTPVTITVGASTRILQLQPGQKSLADASPIKLSQISTGDRALAVGATGANHTLTAHLVVAMKKSEIEAHRHAEEEAWQHNGVGGIVTSVDPSTHTLVISSTAHKVTIHASPSIPIRKYAEGSVAFKDTRPSSFSAIKPGDQLRAKGPHSANGTVVTANAIVFGDFQNIAGLELSVNTAQNTLTLKDLATHKPVTLAVAPTSTLRKLPPRVAKFVAMRLHQMKQAQHSSEKKGAKASREEHQRTYHPGTRHMAPGQQAGNGFDRVLDRSTPIQLNDLHKGDAVMIVASRGTQGKPGTALTLLSGVAPMLRASRKASQSMFSSSWSLGGGQAAAGGGAGGAGGGHQSGSSQ